MRFSHTDLKGQLEWGDVKHINELVVESPKLMRRIMHDLSSPDDSISVRFTQAGKPLAISKDIDVIFNPLRLDFNNRRAMTALLKLLVKSSLSDEHYLETNTFKSSVLRYLDNIVDSGQFEFEVATDDFAVDSIAKAVSLHIVGDQNDFVELLTDYMSMMAELAGTKLFVFINLRAVLDDGELARLIGNIENHQLDMMLIESHAYGRIDRADRIIVDADLCEL